MSVASLLRELNELGVELSLDGERLRIKAPKGALTPAMQLRLRESKEELLELLASVQGAEKEPAMGDIPAHDPREPAPLSAAQHRLWFLDQLNPGTAFLNLPFTVSLKGSLDIEAMRWVAAQIGQRHDALRSAIRLVGDEPMQVVEGDDLDMELVDFSHLPEAERDRAVEERRQTEMARPFDLSKAPLIRFFLFRKSLEEHWFMFVTNHVVFDGWSHDVIFREVRELYEARVNDKPASAPPPVRFADFVRWHRSWLEAPEQQKRLEDWTKRLSGMPGVLDVPADRVRPPEMSHAGVNRIWKMEPALIAKLRRVALAHGATLNMLALATVELMLARYSGQEDFGVGVPVHGRVRAECEELIGMFVNTLVVRSDIPAGGRFSDLLARVRDSSVSALSNQDVPFERLVQVLQPARDRARTPLYQAMFSYQEASRREYSMANLVLEQIPSFSGSTGTDITFWIRDHGTWALAVVEMATDLFDEETAALWLRSWRCMLEAVADNPDLPLAKVPVLAAEDEHRLFVELNDTATDLDDTLIHRTFERTVDRTPDKPAVYFEARQVTYQELDRRANRIAHALVERGVGPDTLVGVSLPRGIDLVATLLGILKAGGGYVPLDTSYPRERIEYFLENSRAKVLVSTSRLASMLDTNANRLLLDDDATYLESLPESRLDRQESAKQLAYVIYTSGSTGKPKGVMVEHRNVINFFAAMRHALGLDDTGTWLAGTSTSFDISVLELISCVCHGRSVVVVGDMLLGQAKDERYSLQALAERYGVTHFQCTPSQARILLLEPESRRMLGRLRQLVVGGEALSQDLGDELAKLVPGEVINGYGPTETTIYSTMARVRDGERITIGRPVRNTCVFILDPAGNVVPPGAVGELCIGGKGVTRGYLGRPELTNERFIVNRYRPDLSERLYKTGDLVRLDRDGNIAYLGRNDHQVKIRGYRIELGEIEAALRALDGIDNAVVTAHGEGAGKRLVGYVVAGPAFAGEDRAREELRRQLPEFMVPAVFVRLQEFPLTPNGKVDRKALPEPFEAKAASNYVAPTNDIERRLSKIWGAALGLPRLGISDNFFDLGGHSLMAVRIFNEVARDFGVRLPLAALFDAPTIELLAKRLEEPEGAASKSEEDAWTTVVPIQPKGTLPPFFCVAGVGGNPMNLRELSLSMGADQPFFGLQYRGVDGAHAPHHSIEEMAAEFVEDIRKVQPNGPYYLGGYSVGGLPAYEVARLLRVQGEEVGLVVLLDTFNPRLPTWTLRQRIFAHLDRLLKEGPRYVKYRVLDRIDRTRERALRRFHARLAAHSRFEYRHAAVELACLEAQGKYDPGTYAGDVLLLQAELRLGASDGIGYQEHESNGWRDRVTGNLIIEHVDCQHLDIVLADSAPKTAAVIARSLKAARDQRERRPPLGAGPAGSGGTESIHADRLRPSSRHQSNGLSARLG